MSEEIKTVVLGDFSKREFDYLNELIADHLADMDINPASFSFHLEVDYREEADNETHTN